MWYSTWHTYRHRRLEWRLDASGCEFLEVPSRAKDPLCLLLNLRDCRILRRIEGTSLCSTPPSPLLPPPFPGQQASTW